MHSTIGSPARRAQIPLQFHQVHLGPSTTDASGNTQVDWASGLSFLYTNNTFADGANSGAGQVVSLPEGIDVGAGIDVTVTWYCEVAAGDVEIEVAYLQVPNGTVLDGSLATGYGSSTQITTVPGVAKTMVTNTFHVDLGTLVPGERVPIGISRDAQAGNANDTAGGNVVLVDAYATAFFRT